MTNLSVKECIFRLETSRATFAKFLNSKPEIEVVVVKNKQYITNYSFNLVKREFKSFIADVYSKRAYERWRNIKSNVVV